MPAPARRRRAGWGRAGAGAAPREPVHDRSWVRSSQRYEEQQRERSIAALKRRAAALGFAVIPTTTTP
jgi:hypothetical protein